MGLADDLLEQARFLAAYEGENSKQTSLRRSVSTAYYALFHLLAEDASDRWHGSLEAKTGIQRGFNHGTMRSVSNQFQKTNWRDWHDSQRAVPLALMRVAKAFTDLQDFRQSADYDNHEQWNFLEVDDVLQITRAAFDDWQAIRTDPMAGNYLLAMLLPKQR